MRSMVEGASEMTPLVVSGLMRAVNGEDRVDFFGASRLTPLPPRFARSPLPRFRGAGCLVLPHDHVRADLHAAVEIDHVVIDQAEAA
jgi:hypothetical protein